jgi:hypothetical protein
MLLTLILSHCWRIAPTVSPTPTPTPTHTTRARARAGHRTRQLFPTLLLLGLAYRCFAFFRRFVFFFGYVEHLETGSGFPGILQHGRIQNLPLADFFYERDVD